MTTPPNEIGVAVVGTGAIAREHVRSLAGTAGFHVVAVAGADVARAQAVAALAPGAVGSGDIAAVIADPAVAAVDVCGHTAAHARWTIAAGAAGKHVMVEKPVALSLGELDQMIAATRSSSLLAGQTVRFQPAVAELKAQLAAGVIGRPRLIHIQWYVGHVWPNGWRAWQLDPQISGGHPVHNGTHAFDLLAWLTGRRGVRVFTRSFPGAAAQMPVPDSFQVTIRMDDGTLALLELSYALRRPADVLRRVIVVGGTGTLTHSTEDDFGLSSDMARAVPASVDGAFGRQTAHWLDVVRGRTQPTTTATEMRTALALGLAAQRSLACRDVVALDPTSVEDGR